MCTYNMVQLFNLAWFLGRIRIRNDLKSRILYRDISYRIHNTVYGNKINPKYHTG
jgi:hypothetical protein